MLVHLFNSLILLLILSGFSALGNIATAGDQPNLEGIIKEALECSDLQLDPSNVAQIAGPLIRRVLGEVGDESSPTLETDGESGISTTVIQSPQTQRRCVQILLHVPLHSQSTDVSDGGEYANFTGRVFSWLCYLTYRNSPTGSHKKGRLIDSERTLRIERTIRNHQYQTTLGTFPAGASQISIASQYIFILNYLRHEVALTLTSPQLQPIFGQNSDKYAEYSTVVCSAIDDLEAGANRSISLDEFITQVNQRLADPPTASLTFTRIGNELRLQVKTNSSTETTVFSLWIFPSEISGIYFKITYESHYTNTPPSSFHKNNDNDDDEGTAGGCSSCATALRTH